MTNKRGRSKLSLQDFANVSQIVQALLVILSLFFIWYQLREGVRLAKAENTRSLVEYSSSFNASIIQNADLTSLWYSYGKNFGPKDIVPRLRYRDMLVTWLTFHENIYYQKQNNLLDDSIYNAWLADLQYTVRNHNLDIVSDNLEEVFPGGFGEYLNRLNAENPR